MSSTSNEVLNKRLKAGGIPIVHTAVAHNQPKRISKLNKTTDSQTSSTTKSKARSFFRLAGYFK